MKKEIDFGVIMDITGDLAYCIGYSRSLVKMNLPTSEMERFERDVITKIQKAIDLLNK
jgi:hypothetical protein